MLRLLQRAGVTALVLVFIGAAPAQAKFGFLRSIQLDWEVPPDQFSEEDIAVDAQGNLYATRHDEVQKYDPSGTHVATLRPEQPVVDPAGIETVDVDDARGILYAGAPGDGLIHRFLLDGAELAPLSAVAYEIAVDQRDGSLFTVPGTALAKLSPTGETLLYREPTPGGELDISNGRLFFNSYGIRHELSPTTLESLSIDEPVASGWSGGIAVGDRGVWLSYPGWSLLSPSFHELEIDGGGWLKTCEMLPEAPPPATNPGVENLARGPGGWIYALSGDRVEVFGEGGNGRCRRGPADYDARLVALNVLRTFRVGRRLRVVVEAGGEVDNLTLTFHRHWRRGRRSHSPKFLGWRRFPLDPTQAVARRFRFVGPRGAGQPFKPGRYSVEVTLRNGDLWLVSEERSFRVLPRRRR